jgi:hypothetical protein
MKIQPRTILKLAPLVMLSLLWFVLVQAEYEIITKPELRRDFPVVQGLTAVYVLGFILLIISVVILYPLMSVIKELKNRGQNIIS